MTVVEDSGLDYQRRFAAAREAMADRDMDAVLLTGGPNLVYFTGATGMLEGTSGSRPIFCVLPADGDPVLLAHTLLGDELERSTPIEDIRTYDRLSDLPTAELRDLLESRGVASGRIGLEFGVETRFDAPVGDLLDFIEGQPGLSMVDAAGLLWELRRVKSEAELRRIEAAIEITGDAYERTFEATAAGDTEAEIARRMVDAMRDEGGTAPWVLMTSAPEDSGRIARSPGSRTVAEGEMVWMDAGCAVEGYFSDFSRAGVIGGPSEAQRRTQQAVHDATIAGIDAVEPGIPASEVAKQCDDALQGVIDATDSPIRTVPSRDAARVGHSLGLQVTELPSLSAADSTTLEAGMVLTMEPAIATDDGTFHVEENLVVTDDGARRLTPDRWELWSC